MSTIFPSATLNAHDPSRTPKTLHRIALATLLVAFVLVFFGAMTTTRDAGLAVPDWPLSFGSVNPPQYLQDIQVFWEHSHRLLGALVGLLAIGLALWATFAEQRLWVRWLARGILAGIILQGVLGGLRVLERSLHLAIIHGCFAHLMLGLLFLMVIATGRGWYRNRLTGPAPALSTLRWLSAATAFATYLQVVFGAIMRHHKAGLAIPVFPQSTLDGRWIPADWNFGIATHFLHRSWALVVFGLAVATLIFAWRHFRRARAFLHVAAMVPLFIVLQALLGGLLIWHLRPFTLTSLHVVVGTGILAGAVYLVAYAFSAVPHGPLLAQDEPAQRRTEGEVRA